VGGNMKFILRIIGLWGEAEWMDPLAPSKN
jgi:hypothetical protein